MIDNGWVFSVLGDEGPQGVEEQLSSTFYKNDPPERAVDCLLRILQLATHWADNLSLFKFKRETDNLKIGVYFGNSFNGSENYVPRFSRSNC